MKYEHGGNAYRLRKKYPGKKMVDFSASVNPLGVPEKMIRAIQEAMPRIAEYPDSSSEELIEALARFEKVDPACILAGNGASDLILRACFGLQPKTALIAAPSFSEYGKALAACGAQVRHAILRPEDGFRLGERFLAELCENPPDMAIVCTPNNPTGRLIEPDVLEEAVRFAQQRGILLIVDECFLDFCQNAEAHSAKKWLASPSVLVLRALTKIFAVPGLRVGYMISQCRGIREKIQSVSQSWPISCFAQAAGESIDGLGGFIEETRLYVAQERARLISALEAHGAQVFPSDANYLLFRAQPGMDGRMWERGVLIRPCANFV
ncbi:MAG: aminotransferase class I/II-fold pyridoxal phosphate-dependent enzyme, partial [Eubacteriaceae bacterium]|nr:aminotransferase class I/II-fold pyridoxal phosphate-dependent enzyme [Eubacteriaceae bacterium]